MFAHHGVGYVKTLNNFAACISDSMVVIGASQWKILEVKAPA
jgi:hypothetical protein